MVKVLEIFRAVSDGNAEALDLLLRQDRTEVNKFNEGQRTPLMVACVKGDSHVVQVLLNNGADVNKTAFGTPSALMLAIQHRHPEVVKLILQHDPDTTFCCKAVGGGTALSHALKLGLHDMADILLQNGVDINGRDKMGLTALMYAAIDGNYAEVEYLLNKGANMNLTCNTLAMLGQKTALLAAAMHDHASVVRLLVDRGAEILPPHYREFLKRSEVEETEEARTCSALLREAAERSDCRKRENAVDLTGMDDVINKTSTATAEPVQAGRGRGIMHAIPAWMQAQNEGLIPRHVETMREFQLFRQGDLPPPKRGPLYNPPPNLNSNATQFDDADGPLRRSSMHKPFEVIDSDNDDTRENSSKRQRHERRSRSCSRDRCNGRNAVYEENGYRMDVLRTDKPTRNGAYEHDYHQDNTRNPYTCYPTTTGHYSPPRGASCDPNTDNGRYMMNYAAGSYTPKPPRPRPPPKPLLPEPVVLPDVDFVRSKGNALPPGREINSYAELERKRREAEDGKQNGVHDCYDCSTSDNNGDLTWQSPPFRLRFRTAFSHEEDTNAVNNYIDATHVTPANTSAAYTYHTPPPPPPPPSSGLGRNCSSSAETGSSAHTSTNPPVSATCTGQKRSRAWADTDDFCSQPNTSQNTEGTIQSDRHQIIPPLIPKVSPPPAHAQADASNNSALCTPAPVKVFTMSELLGAASQRTKSPVAPSIPEQTWLHGYLSTARVSSQWIATCERVLVHEQGLSTRDMFAALPPSYLDDAHLMQLGLTPMSVQLELRRLHAKLNNIRSVGNKPEADRVNQLPGRKVEIFGTGTDCETE